MFPFRNGLKQGAAQSPLPFNCALGFAIRRVKIIQNGLELNCLRQFLFHADDVSIMGGSIHTVQEKEEVLVMASKKIGIEVNTDKYKYMVIYADQNAGRIHSIKTDNRTFGMVEKFKYLGTILTNQCSFQEEIKSRLKPGKACYHSVQNLLPSSLISKNLKIKIYGNIVLSVVLRGCENFSLTLMDERRLRVLKIRVVRRILGPKRDEVTGNGENYKMSSLMICSPTIFCRI